MVTKGMVRTMIKSGISSQLEHQHYQTTSAGNATVAGNMYTVSQGLTQGTTVASRDGDVIHPEVISLRMVIKAVPTSVAIQVAALYRVILFQDMLNVGVAPTSVDVLPAGAFSAYDIEHTQQSRFKILYDKMHPMTGAYASNNIVTIDTSIRMKGSIFYNGGTNVVGANGKGSIWLLTVTDTTTNISLAEAYYIDLKYTDA